MVEREIYHRTSSSSFIIISKRNLSNKSVKRFTWFWCHFYGNIHRTPTLKPIKVSKICCETANKALNIINNRAIQFVKEGNISKIARKNMRKGSLLEDCIDWHVATDLKHNFIFPTETVLTTKRPDIVIWSVKAKKVFVIELTVPFEVNIPWAHQRKLEKYEDLREQCVRNGWITNVFSIAVGCRCNSTSVFLTNLRLPPSDKRKYMEKIQDKAITPSAWTWQSHRVTTI